MSTLVEVSRFTEEEAREYLEAVLWPNGPVCPHCGTLGNAAKLEGEAHRPGVYKCRERDCRKQFTVTVNTVFHRSHIPLRTWVMAFSILCAAKKGVSAKQLQRELGLGSYQAAWHMCHRIRLAMAKEPLKGMLAGQVEVDETYVGGKPRKGSGEPAKTGRGTKKVPVMALVERGGNVRAMPIERVDARTLKGAIRENVDRGAMILTDEWAAYKGIGDEFKRGHFTVNHGAGEYACGGAHTNTAESYFALLKRGITGSFHHVSKKHLHRYCDEFSFR
jgi:transposase-like protein